MCLYKKENNMTKQMIDYMLNNLKTPMCSAHVYAVYDNYVKDIDDLLSLSVTTTIGSNTSTCPSVRIEPSKMTPARLIRLIKRTVMKHYAHMFDTTIEYTHSTQVHGPSNVSKEVNKVLKKRFKAV